LEGRTRMARRRRKTAARRRNIFVRAAQAIWSTARDLGRLVARVPERISGAFRGTRPALRYFHDVLIVELEAIDARRAKRGFRAVRGRTRRRGIRARDLRNQLAPGTIVDPDNIDRSKTRPQPIPCSAVGVALSGGGIRSAAFSLGALQALDDHRVTPRADYLSTVSGGGYMGASLTASMTRDNGKFPFGTADIRDNDVVGQIRNYSNYLLPSARSAVRNILDVSAILIRGWIANAVVVAPFLIGAALLTGLLYPKFDKLHEANFIPHLIELCGRAAGAFVRFLSPALAALLQWGWDKFSTMVGWATTDAIPSLVRQIVSLLPTGSWIGRLIDAATHWFGTHIGNVADWVAATYSQPFGFSTLLAAALALALLLWVLKRSVAEADGKSYESNDTDSANLTWARRLLGAAIISLLLDLQPLAVLWVGSFDYGSIVKAYLAPAALVGAAVAVATFARKIGTFLESTKLKASMRVRLLRIAAKIAVMFLGIILPLALLMLSWLLTIWLVGGFSITLIEREKLWTICEWAFFATAFIAWSFEANAYSLHQLYKDRLSKAFLFDPSQPKVQNEFPPLLDFKLSRLSDVLAPYHIVNAALNVQGSREANRRGRDADFFTFSRDFIGSDLTHFAPTSDAIGRRMGNPATGAIGSMETIDPRLDLGAAVAISGAALSANMGSNTIRWLSPTLALLNIRLGYWLRNPRDLARPIRARQLRKAVFSVFSKFYLLLEMLNLIDENSSFVYLSDGGHIENLGIYQLLKRGCRLIIAIDAEADADISCSSLLKLERYARIDLGIRVILPWEEITRRYRETNQAVDPATPDDAKRHHGPHAAIGRIYYEDGTEGVLLYFKSSLTGDEKDYILDYKKRNMDFPHETTGDQFFTEEQFEVYRALGYHVVHGYFSGTDHASWLRGGPNGWASREAADREVRQALRY
jgi:hypothetical protein